MVATEIRIELASGGSVTGLLERPASARPTRGWGLLLGHGLRNDLDAPDLAAAAAAALGLGGTVLRYRFPFREAGRSEADAPPRLLEAARAAAAALRASLGPEAAGIVLGGRSLGARVASLVAVGGEPCLGLLLLAYPLHAVETPDLLRDTQLYVAQCPMLFVTGDQDPLCRPERLSAVAQRLGASAQCEVLPGLDHGFRASTPQGSAPWPQIQGLCSTWLARLVERSFQ